MNESKKIAIELLPCKKGMRAKTQIAKKIYKLTNWSFQISVKSTSIDSNASYSLSLTHTLSP